MRRLLWVVYFMLLSVSAASAVPMNSKIEGYWLYTDAKKLLEGRGFERLGHRCLDASPGAVAVHCTSDFINVDGVRISVAVRKRVDVDHSPGRAYRLVCTGNCSEFAWGQLLSGRGRRDPLE
jgi:hypothetical protein